MRIIDKISISELKEVAGKMFGELVKADVDVERQIVVIDMPMHYDGEQVLLEQGSKQGNIWGINLHPYDYGSDDFIEFDSMINIRPSQGNPSRDVLDETLRARITEIISGVVHE
ncbi:MAG: DUF5674 family protein [Candidatus Saccharimonadales bacterium]